ncbi:MAG TPA: peptide chain release factor 1 [Candidatus Hydrogenedentes bacterium]|nr:peptide chain release factor 1 [Candidatus Hydrogenedentota bacterium]
MREKLLAVVEKSERLTETMSSPEVAVNPESLRKYAKALAEVTDIVACFRRYELYEKSLEEAERVLASESDPEILELAQEERDQLRTSLSGLEHELKLLLLPTDPNDEKNTILEIRAGTGGEEAALFVADLFRMYSRFAELKGWKMEMISSNPTDLGGFKEISFQISGERVYSQLKWEAGVHRVQRVPDTEAQGRIHTSAATVAVLPEAQEIEIQIDPNDLQIDVYRSQGHGGQSVNTTDSAVRVTHKPTGLVVTCQDEKSQFKNKAQALRVLRARLYDLKQHQDVSARSEERRSQVGSGDRSERIRTYNFPQNRMTDHRIGLTLYNLDRIVEGEIQGVIDALIAADRAAKLAELN